MSILSSLHCSKQAVKCTRCVRGVCHELEVNQGSLLRAASLQTSKCRVLPMLCGALGTSHSPSHLLIFPSFKLWQKCHLLTEPSSVVMGTKPLSPTHQGEEVNGGKAGINKNTVPNMAQTACRLQVSAPEGKGARAPAF